MIGPCTSLLLVVMVETFDDDDDGDSGKYVIILIVHERQSIRHLFNHFVRHVVRRCKLCINAGTNRVETPGDSLLSW